MASKSDLATDAQVKLQGFGRVLRKSSVRPLLRLLPFTSVAPIITSSLYLAYRVRCLHAVDATVIMRIALLIEILAAGIVSLLHSLLSSVAEIIEVPAICIQFGVLLSATQAKGDRLPQSLSYGHRPSVDVFVTHCREGHDIVLDTAKAACALKWPSNAFRVIVLDDSGSVELAEKVERMDKEVSPRLLYVSRGVQVKTYSKAENLNFGLRYVEGLPDGKGEFVGVLDVDMIPEPEWLCKVLPYVSNDDKAGLACPPQRYYNLPAGDPLGILTDDLPGECMIRLQDYTDSTFCTGSGFVARRCALDAIGGIPEETLQEDDLTSYKLLAAGWHSVYVPVSVQWGLGPDTFAAYLKQSKRWAVGIIHVNSLMWTDWAQKLSWTERFIFILWGIVIGSTAFIWTLVFVALPLLTMSGDRLIPIKDGEGLIWLMRLAFINFIAQSLYHGCLSAFLDFRLPIHTLFGAVWTQPWKLAMIFQYFIAPWVFNHDVPHFEPTGLAVHGKTERVARVQRSRMMMFKVVFWDCAAYLHLILLVICTIGAMRWGQIVHQSLVNGGLRRAAINLVSGIAWPPIFLLWLALAQSAWIPLAYVVNILPPSRREYFLVRDASNGVKYAAPQAKA